ncbi:MAG: hypothetical protein LBK72_07205 [Bifidobacteriaceae bacterium]|nr:hypothetical protein [Bifidobacteriaceae bacterium]
MSQGQFRIVFDGPALETHTMPVRDLASALLALSETFGEASRLLAPEAPPPALNIRATDGGSFDVSLILVEGREALETLGQALAGTPVTAVVNTATLAGFVWQSMGVIKWLRNRRVAKAEPALRAGQTRITLADGTSLDVGSEAVRLVQSVEYREHLEEFVRPLERDGVESLRVVDRETTVTINADEQRLFTAPTPPAEEELNSTKRQTWVQVVGIELDYRKWRFTEGESRITAPIEDIAFRTRIDNDEVTFGKGDLLHVELRTRQYRDRSGAIKAEYGIVKVIEHRSGGRMLPLEGFDDL